MKFYIYFTISAVNACVCVSDWNPCTLYAQPKVDGIMHLLLFAAEGQLFECTNIRSLKSCTYLVRPIYVEHPHIMSYWITPTHRAECDRTRLCYLCVPSTCVRVCVFERCTTIQPVWRVCVLIFRSGLIIDGATLRPLWEIMVYKTSGLRKAYVRNPYIYIYI